jgi:hypothetical protein
MTICDFYGQNVETVKPGRGDVVHYGSESDIEWILIRKRVADKYIISWSLH